MNGFQFQYLIFNKYLSNIFDIDFVQPDIKKHTSWYKFIPLNFLLLRKLYRRWNIGAYNIIHINTTENFLNFRKNDKQISIAESHWFDFGVNYARFLQDEKNVVSRILWWLIDKCFGAKIRRKIQEFDIYYCSTPDMLEPLQNLVRKDVKWLPNPINTDLFSPNGPVIKLEWNPACFFPTRLHGDKKPEIAIDIFQNIIKKKFPWATLHLLNQWFEVDKYKSILSDKKTYFWHNFMDKQTLAAKIRWSDLCFGDFSIGGLSLMPMQIMACKKPIITYDKHEIVKVAREDLPGLARNILEDETFKNQYIQKNYEYIINHHSEKAICQIHLDNIKPFLKSKLWLTDNEINEFIL